MIFRLAYTTKYVYMFFTYSFLFVFLVCLYSFVRAYSFAFQIQEPINPGQEFPLPLHLCEAGRVSWRPWGKTYLWSEPQNISNFRTLEGRMGFLRSFISYPPVPSIDPFRCCISVQDISLPPSDSRAKRQHIKKSGKHLVEQRFQSCSYLEKSTKQSVHYVVIMTPLKVKNYLPEAICLIIESCGVSRAVTLSEVRNVHGILFLHNVIFYLQN